MINLNWSEKELSNLRSSILRRVQAVWFFKKVLLPAGAALLASGAVLAYALKTRHVAAIWTNMQGLDLPALARLILDAVQKTDLDFLVMSASASLLALYFGRKLVRETMDFWFKKRSPLTIR